MRTCPLVGSPVIAAALLAHQAARDSTGRNWVYVTASTTDGTAYHGDRYAKCIPAEDSGSMGKTRVYHVTADEDVLEDEYDWYATQVYLAGTRDGTSVVRMGGWSEGSQAAEDDLALAFHFDGLLLFDKPM